MKTTNRLLNNNESSKFSESIRRLEDDSTLKLNWIAILVSSFLTVLSMVHIRYYDKSSWSLISKLLVCSCPVVIWVIIENKYKARKERARELGLLKEIERNKNIDVIQVNANRIIEFAEKEDEGILYLIEDEDGQGIYLWDEQYLIPKDKPFPCDRFDIYIDNNFKYAIEEKINCIGRKIEPIKISGADKWNYFKDRGFPADLEIEINKLDEVLEKIKKMV